MPELEYELEQFITFPEEEQYYDLCFEYVSPLYVSAIQDGWSLVRKQDETDKEVQIVMGELPAPVSKDCIEFCESLGLRSILINCLAKAKIIFSNMAGLLAELDYFRDDQGEDVPHVVIRIEVNSDQQTALQEYDQLVRWIANEVHPSDSQLFTVTVKRV